MRIDIDNNFLTQYYIEVIFDMDTGLNSLVAIARFHQLPAEADQLAHEYGVSGEDFGDTEILRAAKALTLKAKQLKPILNELKPAMLPAIAKAKPRVSKTAPVKFTQSRCIVSIIPMNWSVEGTTKRLT